MRKQLGILGAAAVLAVLGIVALVRYANNADDRAFEGTELVAVVRATSDVPVRTAAGDLSSMVETVEVPRAAVVPNAVTSLSQVDGQVTSVALVPGDQLSSPKFAAPDTVTGEVVVPKGMQELTIPVSGARLVGGALRAGDRAGVMSSYDGRTSNPINNLLILRVDNGVAGSEDAAGTLVTVAVGTLDAERIVHTMEFGKIWLTKQNKDTKTSGGRPISADDVLIKDGAP